MKKLIALMIISISLFALDFTFTKAFREFNKGVNLEKKDPQSAMVHFQKAYIYIETLKNKDTSQINYMLGRMYCNGWGVEKDYAKAEKYFLRAIELGNKRANCCLARLYIKEGKPELAKKYLEYAKTHKSIANYCSDINQSIVKETK